MGRDGVLEAPLNQYTGKHLPAGIELQERGALRHGVEGILDLLEGPAGPVAHLARRAEHRIDRHGPEGCVKSPICAFIGYPVEDGSTGSIFRLTGQCIAMSSTCENKEAAWEFMRTVYTEPKDGTPDNNSAIPIWKVLYDKQKDTLMRTEQEIVPFS